MLLPFPTFSTSPTKVTEMKGSIRFLSSETTACCLHKWAVKHKINANSQHQILYGTERCTEIGCEEMYCCHFGIVQ